MLVSALAATICSNYVFMQRSAKAVQKERQGVDDSHIQDDDMLESWTQS